MMTGMTMPYTTPYSASAREEEKPAAIRRMGKITEMSEFMSDEDVRMAVMGSDDLSRGKNSPRGEANLPPFAIK